MRHCLARKQTKGRKELCRECDLGAKNTTLRSNFLNLSSSQKRTSSSPCTHNNTENMCATVYSSSNTSAKFTNGKNGSLTCSINGTSALGHRKGISIASLNVNSLLFYIDEVRTLMQDLGLHILAINETRLDDSIDDALIGIDGYSNKGCDRNRTGGRVALYIKDAIFESALFTMTCQNRP